MAPAVAPATTSSEPHTGPNSAPAASDGIVPGTRATVRTAYAATNAALNREIRPLEPVFPTRTGARRDRHNLLQRVVKPAVKRVNEKRAERRSGPLQPITSHIFRRTYISLLFAAGAEPPYVMSQVGHEDAKTTLNIYAQVVRHRDRTGVGAAFDRLLTDSNPR